MLQVVVTAIVAAPLGAAAALGAVRARKRAQGARAGDEIASMRAAADRDAEEVRAAARRLHEDAERARQAAEREAGEESRRVRRDLDAELRRAREAAAEDAQALREREGRVEAGERDLRRRHDEADARERRAAEALAAATARDDEARAALERAAGLTADEARQIVIQRAEEEARGEAAALSRRIEMEARETAERQARQIVVTTIQRTAARHTADATVSVVALASDDLKGRIIGREGRNIRALEHLTGVDVIIDETPQAVALSAFDPVRREVARVTLERLLADGRIHPASIEDAYYEAKAEIEDVIAAAGRDACLEAGVHGLDPELMRLLGRLRFRTSYGQNVLHHLLECSHVAALMAAELGADARLARRAALLHDIGKALDQEAGGSHALAGAEICRRHGEDPEVCHAVAAHHNEVAPATLEAVIVQAADAVSASRPGARGEALESYLRRMHALEDLASAKPGVERCYAVQAGREIRVIVRPAEVDDDGAQRLSREIAREIERELDYPGMVKVTVIRESRATDVAR
jgi:ribonucrease Y